MRQLSALVLTHFFLSLYGVGYLNAKSIATHNSASACGCTITQGEEEYDLDFFTSDISATDFYAYGFPNGSSSNTGLEISNGMVFFIYEDQTTGQTSLIILIDASNDGSGGDVFLTFNCLPSNADIIFSDDGGELSGSPPNIVGNFSWASCCSDGGIIDNIGCGDSFVINPDVGSGIDFFSFVSGDITDPEYIEMPELNCPIIINCGGTPCCDEAFEFEAEAENASCLESSDGAIDLDIECAADPTFLWSNGASSEDIDDIAPGIYTVTITDANGCALSDSYTVGNNPSPLPEINGALYYCIGEDDLITLFADEGYEDYIWSTGETDQSIEVDEGGTYIVTVTDALGCSGEASITVEEVPIPEPEISGPSFTCFEQDIILDAGGGYDQYEWSSGESSQMIYVYEEDIYTVTVTNSYGCSATASTEIIVYPAPEIEINGPSTLCAGSEVSLFVEEGYEAYLWSTGETSPNINVNEDDEYSVTVTNEYGCATIDIFYVDPAPSPNPQITGPNSFCLTDSILLNAGVGFDSYLWSTGETSQEITLLESGTYAVTVYNDQDCEGIAQHIIYDASIDTTNIILTSCYPLDTGQTITYFENQWGCDSLEIISILYSASDSTYIFNDSCNPLDTGEFVDQFINQFGCDSFSIEIINLLQTDSTYLEEYTCNPSEVGNYIIELTNQYGCDSLIFREVNLRESDTTQLTTYTCDPNDEGLSEILYQDINGCDSLVITNSIYFSPDTTIIQLFTCEPDLADTSQVLLNSIYGCDSLVINYNTLLQADTSWIYSNSCNASDTGLVINTYLNQWGCDSLIYNYTSLSPPTECLLELTVLADTISCTQTSGYITLTYLAGTAPFYFNWSNPNSETGSGIIDTLLLPIVIDNIPPGDIELQIMDSGGYSNTIYTSVFQAEPLDITISSENISCFGEMDGSAGAHVTAGGLAPYKYQWSNGSEEDSITNLPVGTYSVTISDATNCEAIDLIDITEPDALHIDYQVSHPDCTNDGLGTIAIENYGGGLEPYQIELNTGSWSSGLFFGGLNPGQYDLFLSDSNGCTIMEEIIIIDYILPEIELGDDITINLGETVELKPVSNYNLTDFDTIDWIGVDCLNCVEVSLTPKESKNITLIVTDSLGCKTRDELYIEVIPPPEIYAPNIFSPDRNGDNDRFTIYSNSDQLHIESLNIYDRWGNLVFAAKGIPLNNTQYGWDGLFNGQPVNSGVFIYSALITDTNGNKVRFAGDLLIIR